MIDLVFVSRVGTASESLGFIHTKRKRKRKQSFWRVTDFVCGSRGGYRISQRRLRQAAEGGGRQPIIWPIFPENCMKIKKIWSKGGTSLAAPLRSATGIHQLHRNQGRYRIFRKRGCQPCNRSINITNFRPWGNIALQPDPPILFSLPCSLLVTLNYRSWDNSPN